MKQSYNIEVSGVKLNIVTEDGAEFVEATVAELEESVQNMILVGRNYSKLDALALLALDYLGEYRKAESKIKNLEAQIEILEANIRRLRDGAEDVTPETETAAEEAVPEEIPEETEPTEEAPAEPVAAEEKSEDTAKEDEDDSARDQKFRQLEAFLGSQLKFDLDKE